MQPAVFGESKCGKILSEVIQGSSAKRKAALLRYGCSRGRLAGLGCSALSAHGRRPAAAATEIAGCIARQREAATAGRRQWAESALQLSPANAQQLQLQ